MYVVNGKGSFIRLIAGAFVLGSVFLYRLSRVYVNTFSLNWFLSNGTYSKSSWCRTTQGYTPSGRQEEIGVFYSLVIKIKHD